MKKEDLNAFKGELKTALQTWAEGKIDAVFPGKASVRTLMKRGLNNYLAKEDAQINKMIDYGFLFLADELGAIDTDTMVDTLKDLFSEMERKNYHLGFVHAEIGMGEAVISVSGNPLFDLIIGDFGGVKFTVEDIDELKLLFN